MGFSKKIYYSIVFNILIISYLNVIYAQPQVLPKYKVSGVVIDSVTNEVMPLVPVMIAGTPTGTNTNLDGEFFFSLRNGTYIFEIKYLGYEPFRDTILVQDKDVTGLRFFLKPLSSTLEEVVITPGENPADRIVRNAIKHRRENSMDKLEAYEHDAYNKLVITLDNIKEDRLDKGLLKPIGGFLRAHAGDSAAIDTNQRYKFAIFISETISKVYYKKPGKRKEVISASQASGVENNEYNLLSSLLTEITLSANYISFLGKQFMNPVADGAFGNYKYFITGLEVTDRDTTWCIEIYPKRPFDAVFKGRMYIENKRWGVRKIDLTMNTDPNINFVEGIRIRAQADEVNGNWVTTLSDVEVNFKNDPNKVGIIGRTSSMKYNYTLNQPKDDKFFKETLEIEIGAGDKQKEYWKESRRSPLEHSEQLGYNLIDTLKTKSIWTIVINTMEFVTTGKKEFKYFSIGPYSQLFTFNVIEGPRNRVGLYTNTAFSKKWYFGGHIAYGWKDKKLKYNAEISYKLSIKPKVQVGVNRTQEIEQAGYPNFVNDGTGLMTSLLFRVPLRQMNYFTETNLRLYADIMRGLSGIFYARVRSFTPSSGLDFYYSNSEGRKVHEFQNTEFGTSLRISFKESYILKGGSKVYTGSRFPQFYLDLAVGVRHYASNSRLRELHLSGGDFNYQKMALSMTDKMKLGRFGYINYTFTAGKVFGVLPYPNLYVFRGSQSYGMDPIGANLGALASVAGSNRSSTYDPVGFNLMYFYEFIADQYFVGGFDHHLEGWILNKFPLIRKLKLKEVLSIRAAYGTLTQANKDINNQAIQAPDKQPYLEAGVGIENILKILRTDFVWRLNYHNPTPPLPIRKYRYNFGIRFNLSISF